jgi:hypothetical protein
VAVQAVASTGTPLARRGLTWIRETCLKVRTLLAKIEDLSSPTARYSLSIDSSIN